MANRIGPVVAANVLSVATRGLGIFLWYFLRLIYRREPKLIAAAIALVLALAALVWLIV